MEILGFSLLAIAFVWFVFQERDRANSHNWKMSQFQESLIKQRKEQHDEHLALVRSHLSLAEKEAAFERKRAAASEKELAAVKEATRRAVESRALPFYIKDDETDAKEEQLLKELANEPVYQDEVPGLGR